MPTDETSSSETAVSAPADAPGPVDGGVVTETWVVPNGGGATAPSESRPARRRGRVLAVVALGLVVLAGGVVIVLVASGSSTSPASVTGGPASARGLLQSSMAAANQAGTFHYVSRSTSSGSTQTTIGDAAPDRGRQVITIGSHTFTVLVVGTEAFFKGDAVTMQSELSLDPLVAQEHAGQWISLQPSDAAYASVYAAVTTPSALSDSITIEPRAQLAPVTSGTTKVIPIRGRLTPVGQTPATGTARLDVQASRPHLPVRFTGSGTISNQQATVSVDFSNWGEAVSVEAPAGALAYSSVQIGGLPSGGSGTVLT